MSCSQELLDRDPTGGDEIEFFLIAGRRFTPPESGIVPVMDDIIKLRAASDETGRGHLAFEHEVLEVVVAVAHCLEHPFRRRWSSEMS